MSLKEFFLNDALEYGIPNIRIERVKNTGSKHLKYATFKITDGITSREYFMRCGSYVGQYSWVTVKCKPTEIYGGRTIQQYGVLSFNGGIRKLNIYQSLFVIERHIAKQRKKFEKS